MLTTIQFDLARGERLLWSGAPRQGLVLRPADALLVPFSLLWGGFALFWEASVLLSAAPLFFRLWGVPFVLVGLYLIAGRFWYDAWRRGRTTYGVTTERVLIAAGRQVKSLDLRTLSDVTLELEQRRDGSGTITFGPSAPWGSWYAGTAWPGVRPPAAFEMVPDAKRVYELIREAQRSGSRPAA
jgi:hypothetical protein